MPSNGIRVRTTDPKVAIAVKARKKGGKLNLHEVNAILRLRAEGKSPAAIGDIIERSVEAVRSCLNRYSDTTAIAEATFKRDAVVMAERVIKRGSTEELIDVMSRPNIGVLAPAVKPGTQPGGFSIQVSVGVASLGATKAEPVLEGHVVETNG